MADNSKENRPRFGAHMSIAGGIKNALYRARDAGCQTMAMFSASPRVWKRGNLKPSDNHQFLDLKEKFNIHPVILHSLYLVNLATVRVSNFERAISAMEAELQFSSSLQIPWVVTHPGSHRETDLKEGIRRISSALDRLFETKPYEGTGIALETTAGGGTVIGHRFEHLRDIMDHCSCREKLTVCLDTCHIFAAGYDIRSEESWHDTADEFDRIIGLDKLSIIHLNDSKMPLGSHVDRHDHIGEGEIGLNGFRSIVTDTRLINVPMILETPKDKAGEWDRRNIHTLQSLVTSD